MRQSDDVLPLQLLSDSGWKEHPRMSKFKAFLQDAWARLSVLSVCAVTRGDWQNDNNNITPAWSVTLPASLAPTFAGPDANMTVHKKRSRSVMSETTLFAVHWRWEGIRELQPQIWMKTKFARWEKFQTEQKWKADLKVKRLALDETAKTPVFQVGNLIVVFFFENVVCLQHFLDVCKWTRPKTILVLLQ